MLGIDTHARVQEDCNNSIIAVKFSKVWGAEIIWPDLKASDFPIDFRHKSYHFIAPNYADGYWYGACQYIPTGHRLVVVCFPHAITFIVKTAAANYAPLSGRREERKKEGKSVKRRNEYKKYRNAEKKKREKIPPLKQRWINQSCAPLLLYDRFPYNFEQPLFSYLLTPPSNNCRCRKQFTIRYIWYFYREVSLTWGIKNRYLEILKLYTEILKTVINVSFIKIPK